MKWIGTQTIYDNVRLLKSLYLTGDLYLTGSLYDSTGGTGTLPIVAGDITVYNAVNGGDPTISLGSSATERLEIKAQYESGAQGLDGAIFTTYTAGSSTNDGRFTFFVDEVGTFQIRDHGINLYAGKSIQIGNTDIISDSGGTATLSNIDALDATTISTFNAALTAGDITGVTAGTNLSGGGASGAVTINLADASTSVKGAASFSSDNFGVSSGVVTIKAEGVDLTNEVTGVLPSANMDSDTAHLTGVQTFTGRKIFEDKTTFDGDRSVTPGDGVMIHVDASDITDSNTSASGTAAKYAHVSIEHPRLLATNASVTTSDAATLYISGPPVASTNQTITRAHTLWVDSGDVKFDGDLTVDGTIGGNLTGNVTGNTSGSSGSCTGQAATVATIAGLAPNTATTQATQAAITTCANLATVGTIGTGVWQGTAIASAYLDADTAHISATKQMTHHVFVDNMGTTKQYVGLTEADAENTNTANKFLPFPAIVDGKLIKVALRSNKDLTGHTLTWRLESIGAANPNSATPDILGTQSGAGCNNTTMTTYDFTSSLDSGANAFDASDLVYLSVQSNTDFGSNVIYYITCLWEFDLS